MAEWSNATMTDVGAALQAKVNAGKTKTDIHENQSR